MGESLQFGEDEEGDDELEGEERGAGLDTVPELVAEDSNPGEISQGEARGHSDFGIEEVSFYPLASLSTCSDLCSLRVTLGTCALRCVISRSQVRPCQRTTAIREPLDGIEQCSSNAFRFHAFQYLFPSLTSDLPRSCYGRHSDIYGRVCIYGFLVLDSAHESWLPGL